VKVWDSQHYTRPVEHRVRMICPGCGRRYDVRYRGRFHSAPVVKCPSCKKRFPNPASKRYEANTTRGSEEAT